MKSSVIEEKDLGFYILLCNPLSYYYLGECISLILISNKNFSTVTL